MYKIGDNIKVRDMFMMASTEMSIYQFTNSADWIICKYSGGYALVQVYTILCGELDKNYKRTINPYLDLEFRSIRYNHNLTDLLNEWNEYKKSQVETIQLLGE